MHARAMNCVITGLVAATATLALAAPAGAVTLTVSKLDDTADGTCNADCSLREAVVAANATAEADTVLLPAGTLTISIAGQNEQAAATGDLDVLSAGGTLTVRGAGITATAIDAAKVDRIFEVLAGARLELADVTLRNGAGIGSGVLVGQTGNGASLDVARSAFNAHRKMSQAILADNNAAITVGDSSFADNGADPGTPDASTGGLAIFLNDESSGTVARSTFANNRANFGGGAIFVDNTSTLAVSDSTFTGNFAGFGGGALWNQNTARSTVTRTTFTGNIAEFGGGAIFNQNDAVLDISASTISGNRVENGAIGGGGIFNQNDAKLTLTNSTVSGNTATASLGGGGIFHQNNAQTTITSSTISGNRALPGGGAGADRGGGAVFGQDNAVLTLVNSTLSGEGAINGGAVLISNRSIVRATNVTIAANTTGGAGGALFNAVIPLLPTDPHFELANTIIAGNLAAGAPSGCAGSAPATTLRSLGHNIENTSTCALTAAGDLPGTDAALAALGANGGPTATHAIAATSPAKDAGDASRCPATDQRGVARPQFAACDVGAFELESPPPPPPPAPPVPQPVFKPKAVAFSALVSLPSTRRCVSRRAFRIRLRVPSGVQISSAEVRVNGKRVRTIKRSRITAPVDLRNLPRGRFSVEIRVKLADGRTIKGTRKYRTCTKKRRGGTGPQL